MEKEHRHLGAYGLLIKDNKILLIKKKTGPYDGLLDLPGGSLEFDETPEKALVREFLEEVGIKITEYELFDADSVSVTWNYHNELINVHHIGIFYKVLKFENEIQNNIEITEVNDDSLGADFYEISKLKKENLSAIVIIELEKLGYSLR